MDIHPAKQGFSGSAYVEVLDDGVHLKFIAPFSYTTAAGRVITIPPGFVTDGISLPQWSFTALNMTPFTTKGRIPAFIHDWLYRLVGESKEEADLILHEACIFSGLDKWKADLVYAGVHIGGDSSFTADQAIAAAKDGALAPAT